MFWRQAVLCWDDSLLVDLVVQSQVIERLLADLQALPLRELSVHKELCNVFWASSVGSGFRFLDERLVGVHRRRTLLIGLRLFKVFKQEPSSLLQVLRAWLLVSFRRGRQRTEWIAILRTILSYLTSHFWEPDRKEVSYRKRQIQWFTLKVKVTENEINLRCLRGQRLIDARHVDHRLLVSFSYDRDFCCLWTVFVDCVVCILRFALGLSFILHRRSVIQMLLLVLQSTCLRLS